MKNLSLISRVLLSTFAIAIVGFISIFVVIPFFNEDFSQAITLGGLLFFGVIILSYLSFLVYSLLFVSRLKQQVQIVKTVSDRLAAGNLDAKVETTSGDDIGELEKSLENLRQVIKDRLNSSDEARFRAEAILLNVGEGVFAVNLKSEIILFNKVAETLVGFNKEQVLNQRYDQILQFFNSKTKDGFGAFINQVLLEGKNITLPNDTVLVTADKAEIPVAVSSSPIRNQKGLIVGGIVVFRDISHEKEIEEIRTDLISIASHQLRTPLSEIKGLLSLLVDNVAGELNPKQKEYLMLLGVANERMINLVNDLLNISRIEQGRIQLNFQSVSLGALATEVHAGLKVRSDERKQKLLLTIDQNIPEVIADPEKTKEIISNLTENALKYTFDQGTINSRVTASKDGVWFLVKDNGVGIPKNRQKDLFQKFSRVENPLSRLTTGTGLGLYAAKQLVEKQNGKIWFESEEGKGSTFGFMLPLKKN